MRVFDLGAGDDAQPPSNRVLTIPNLLSLARLALLPLVFADLVSGRLVRALVLLAIIAATDWLDGYLARRLNQVSKLGVLLDPISDRALFVVVGVAFVVAGLLPLWALVLLLARDLAVIVVGGVVVARGRTSPPAVTRTGKAATFGLMVALLVFLLAAVAGQGASSPQPVLHVIAWVLLAVNAVLYYVSAGQYARALWRQRAAGR